MRLPVAKSYIPKYNIIYLTIYFTLFSEIVKFIILLTKISAKLIIPHVYKST